MNEHIKALLDKATYDVLGVKQVDQKQFAELIVRECAKFTDHAEELYKHFGVEK